MDKKLFLLLFFLVALCSWPFVAVHHYQSKTLYILNGQIGTAPSELPAADDIYRYTILDEKEAEYIYGSKGKNGAVIIDTESYCRAHTPYAKAKRLPSFDHSLSIKLGLATISILVLWFLLAILQYIVWSPVLKYVNSLPTVVLTVSYVRFVFWDQMLAGVLLGDQSLYYYMLFLTVCSCILSIYQVIMAMRDQLNVSNSVLPRGLSPFAINRKMRIASCILKLVLLTLPLLCLKMAHDPTYVVDNHVVHSATELPRDKDIACKFYLQKEHTVLVITNEFYQKNSEKLQKAVAAYNKQQDKKYSRRGNPIKGQVVLQVILYLIGCYFLVFILDLLHTKIRKKYSDGLTFSESGTTIHTLDDYEFVSGLLAPSVVMLILVWLQWGRLTSPYWLGDTLEFRIGFIVYYALDITFTYLLLIRSAYYLIVDKNGIRGCCPADASHSYSWSTIDLDINWSQVDNFTIQKVEAKTDEDGKKTDAYTQLVLKRPAGSLQNLPKINVEHYDQDLLMACLNHYMQNT